jgi:hypothetical protein
MITWNPLLPESYSIQKPYLILPTKETLCERQPRALPSKELLLHFINCFKQI